MKKALDILRESKIQPTPQRLAVVEYVLKTRSHPTADDVLANARKNCPTVSRATVYNTLNLLAEKGLVVPQTIKEGVVVFDSNLEPHHHFIDDDTGEIYDIPWDELEVMGKDKLKGFEVHKYQVVMRGKRRKK